MHLLIMKVKVSSKNVDKRKHGLFFDFTSDVEVMVFVSNINVIHGITFSRMKNHQMTNLVGKS